MQLSVQRVSGLNASLILLLRKGIIIVAKNFTEEDKKEIRDLLLWNRVEKVGDSVLRVYNNYWDEGKLLHLGGNEGCGGCSSGWYELSELNGSEHNAITAVEFEDDPAGDGSNHENYTGHYRIFVLCENTKIKLAEFEGSDGNGYYGTGYWIKVYE